MKYESPLKGIICLVSWSILSMSTMFIPASCAPKVVTFEPIAPKVTNLRPTVDQTAKAAQKREIATKKLADSTKSGSYPIIHHRLYNLDAGGYRRGFWICRFHHY